MVLGQEVPSSLISNTCIDSMILSCVTRNLLNLLSSLMTSTDLKLIKLGAAGKRKCITVTVPQKLEMMEGMNMVKAAV